MKFGLKSTNKTGAVKPKPGNQGNMAAIFNQNDEDEEEEENGNESNSGFKPNKGMK